MSDDVKFEWHMDEFERAISEKVTMVRLVSPRALRESVAFFELEIQGELLEHEHPPGTKTPSPPGGFPGQITGRLARSLTTKGIALNSSVVRMVRVGLSKSSWSITFGPTAVYSRIQELGGWTGKGHNTYLPPRPYFRPAMMGEWGPKNFIRSMKSAWRDAWSR